MAIKHEPEKIVTWQESGPGVRQPKPLESRDCKGFGLCGANLHDSVAALEDAWQRLQGRKVLSEVRMGQDGRLVIEPRKVTWG
jgi:hypothetical protein